MRPASFMEGSAGGGSRPVPCGFRRRPGKGIRQEVASAGPDWIDRKEEIHGVRKRISPWPRFLSEATRRGKDRKKIILWWMIQHSPKGALMTDKLKLYGFNNLTKTLSFNIYDVCYAANEKEQNEYVAYIDEWYNADRLTKILGDVTDIIGAHVLNISKQDYEPQGASVTILISEEPVDQTFMDDSCNAGVGLYETRKTIVGHLDKSHVTVHTYPEYHPDQTISSFRVDIDVSTCGKISPLKALDYLIGSFDSDIITIDYRVRGFTRQEDGSKVFIDHKINSIQDFIDKKTLSEYDAYDVNVYQANLFHTKMMVKELNLKDYFFKKEPSDFTEEERQEISASLRKEMIEIFSGSNILSGRELEIEDAKAEEKKEPRI
jgi:S-adenosylmethionine decarboxylase